MLKIAKGIPGIRNLRKENATGWHIVTMTEEVGYTETSLNEIIETTGPDYVLLGVQGNVLTIVPLESEV